jgi:STE24 endopeptidase
MVLYGVLRRAPKTWWLWGSLTAILLLVLGEIVGPIYIAPLFNTYKKLEDARVREPILSLARANGITAREVYEQDASRQSKRVSAFVNGFLGTERITLNDNLLNRCTLPEIEAVMGHEIGHYAMHHVYEGILFFGVLIVVGFAAVRWAFDRIVAAKGAAWGVSGAGDVAGLPLFVLLISIYFFVLTPVTNTYIRTQEAEADLFGLNAAREPDAEAKVDLMLGEYRKLDPGKLEEFLFFDHPSGRSRILMAMRWKAEQEK